MRTRKSFEQRFWEKVEKTSTCWNWTAAKARGYGLFSTSASGKLKMAHRVSWEMANEPIPPGAMVDHVCHNKACVNPAHLRLATNKQNQENRMPFDPKSASGVRGVTWDKYQRKWRAQVGHNNKIIQVGTFDLIADAEAAVIRKRCELYTHNDADRSVTFS